MPIAIIHGFALINRLSVVLLLGYLGFYSFAESRPTGIFFGAVTALAAYTFFHRMPHSARRCRPLCNPAVDMILLVNFWGISPYYCSPTIAHLTAFVLAFDLLFWIYLREARLFARYE